MPRTYCGGHELPTIERWAAISSTQPYGGICAGLIAHIRELEAEVKAAKAELSRLRPVVDAAKEWDAAGQERGKHYGPARNDVIRRFGKACHSLILAVRNLERS